MSSPSNYPFKHDWPFDVVDLLWTAKKCIKDFNARAQCLLNYLFAKRFRTSVAVAVVFRVDSTMIYS